MQLDRTINSEAEALANPDKIYLLPTNDDERNVSQGIKYVQESVQLTVTALNYTDSNGSTVNFGQEVVTYTCTVGSAGQQSKTNYPHCLPPAKIKLMSIFAWKAREPLL